MIIAAAGKGERAGFSENKLLFKDFSGKTVLQHTLFAFVNSGLIDEYIVAVSPADTTIMKKLLQKEVKIVIGGKTRSESVKNALEAVTGEIVLIHDGARPFVSKKLIAACIDSAKKFGSGIAAVPSRDTVCKAEICKDSAVAAQCGCAAGIFGGSGAEITEYIGKSGLYSVQTPQGFRTELIKQAYARAGEQTFNDDGEVYAKYIGSPRITEGSSENIKLTFKEDFIANGKLNGENTVANGAAGDEASYGGVANREEKCATNGVAGDSTEYFRNGSGAGEYRFGIGFDCHKFAENRKLILGGVEIPNDKGLLGHSDADVLSHAITDAILSAAAMRDIGYHFPDTDPAYEGADSIQLLKTALGIVGKKGYAVTSVSATIMAEKPKLLKRIPEITANLADAIGITEDKVGIAATTLEGLGFVGREEGICVQATATLLKKEN